MSMIVPPPCPSSGGSSGPEFDTEPLLLCDLDPQGNVLGTALAVYVYDETTGAPVGAPTFVVPGTNTPYVVQGTLGPCPGADQAPVFAGFVCDTTPATPAVPSTLATCPGGPEGPAATFTAGTGMTEGPPGTWTPSNNTNQSLFWGVAPNDPQHGICEVKFVNDPGTGDDPFWQLFGTFIDQAGNAQSLDAVWITAIESALGVGDASDIPAGSSATASTGGTAVTITFDGPSPHSQMFASNGVFFLREQDGDGQAAGVTLAFNPPIRQFALNGIIGVPTPGSISGIQESPATPGAYAIPAQPAGTVQVKQFRNPDGTSFYETLDGAAYVVQGVIGECGDSFEMLLCSATGATFLRRFLITNGAVSGVQDYDLDGNPTFAAEPVQQCAEQLATFRHTPAEVLCWTETANPSNVVQFLRRYLIGQDGIGVVAVLDTLLDGTTAFTALNTGTVAQCCCAGASAAACDDLVLGEICYIPPPATVPGTTHNANWAGATITGPAGIGTHTWTKADFAGAGVTAVATAQKSQNSSTILVGDGAVGAESNLYTLDLGAPRLNVTIALASFSSGAGEKLSAINPPASSATGGVLSAGNTVLTATGAAAASTGSVTFAGPVQFITFQVEDTVTNALVIVGLITFTTEASSTTQSQGTAAVVRDCATGAISYVDLATGATVDLSAVSVVDCEAGGCSTDSSLGTVCYVPPPVTPPGVTLTDDWAGSTVVGANGGPQTITNPNFAAAGITVKETTARSNGLIAFGGISHVQFGTAPAGAFHHVIDLGAPRLNVTLEIGFFGTIANEKLINITPAFTSVTGQAAAAAGNTEADPTVGDGTTFLHFAGPVQTIAFDWSSSGGNSGLGQITFDTIPPAVAQAQGIAAVVRDCDTGAVSYVDLATGLVLDTGTVTIIDCEAAAAAAVTLKAELKLLAAGQSWTPADAAGVVTSVTATVLSGSASITDEDGTVAAGLPAGLTLTWASEDANTLTPPQSIAAVGGQTVVNWTQR